MGNEQLKRALWNEIRAVSLVLRNEWDPIGSGQIPDLPDDEYESYAPALVGMLRQESPITPSPSIFAILSPRL